MKKWIAQASGLLFVCAMAMPTTAAEAPKAYLPQELATEMAKLPAGDMKAGEAVHNQKFCSGCHGKDGLSQNPAWPNVAGQPREVTVKALLDYRSGRRANGAAMMMAGVAKTLSDREISDVAAYYEAVDGGKGQKEEAQIDADIKRMITRGDAKRTITPCATCHGMTAQGNPTGQVPVLQGQNAAYMAATLRDYRSGARSSDILKEMRFFASKLTDKEIDQLTGYYASLRGHQPKDN